VVLVSGDRDRLLDEYIAWARRVRADAERASMLRRHSHAQDFIAWERELATIPLPPRPAPAPRVEVSGDSDSGLDPDEREYHWIEAITVSVGAVWFGLVLFAVIMYVRMAP
jgi:hypothetical protein